MSVIRVHWEDFFAVVGIDYNLEWTIINYSPSQDNQSVRGVGQRAERLFISRGTTTLHDDRRGSIHYRGNGWDVVSSYRPRQTTHLLQGLCSSNVAWGELVEACGFLLMWKCEQNCWLFLGRSNYWGVDSTNVWLSRDLIMQTNRVI